MASMDVFSQDAFSAVSLTAAVNSAPYTPKLLGGLGLFKEVPIYSTTAWVEKQHGRLSLLRSAPRGTVEGVRKANARDAVPLPVPHVPYFQDILAGDIQNLRAFGSETELATVAGYTNDQLVGMVKDHEATCEFHRVGALKGNVLDGDGTTVINNLFTTFGMVQQTQNWLSTDTSFSSTATAVIRKIANALGDDAFTGVLAVCGNDYFDAIIKHASVVAAYERWMQGEFLRVSHMGPAWYAAAVNGFSYQGILFVNYRGKVGNVTYIADNEAYYAPTGVEGLFQEALAPADFMETVNTKGQRFYAKQEPIGFNKGIKLHTQSNVLAMCTRPDTVIKSTWAAA